MSFIPLLLDWFEKEKRELPWRENRTPYTIWISEIILQQTRVQQGIGYYNRFVNAFPTVDSLAMAPEQEVLKLWQGLGYYSRARNLHAAAKQIVSDHQSQLPSSFAALQKLKGIGPYTAAAIASLGFGEAVPAIDGNAYRIYSRLFCVDTDIASSKAHRTFFTLAQEFIPKEKPGAFNEAIMELGATICKPKNPNCNQCPVVVHCLSSAKGTQENFPIKKKKLKIKHRYLHYFFFSCEGKFLLKKRTEKGIWLNLFDFPLLETSKKESQIRWHESDCVVKPLKTEEHLLSHQKLHLSFYAVACSPEAFEKHHKEQRNTVIASKASLKKYPLPKPIERFLADYPSAKAASSSGVISKV